MFAAGIVVAVNEQAVTVRVQFPDKENVISWDLNVNQTRAGVVWMPQIGEQVNCLMDEQLKAGTVIGSFYTKENPPPVQTAEKCHVTFKDGTVIEYDPAAHHLTADIGTGTAAVKASSITLDGDVSITGGLTVAKDSDISGSLSVVKDVTVSGDANVNGTLTGTTAVKDSKGSMQDIRTQFNTHTHICIAPGIDSAPPTVPMP
jgi:phage baseplate assembly protein V|nr:MAG TPA: baseplate assembly protein [Caudoviricetes sp.]